MNLTSDDNTISPPDDLPTDAADFWGRPPMDLAGVIINAGGELPVIDQLGSAPFKKEKGGFPFLGFLASVYEHVSTTAAAELHAPQPQAPMPEAENPVEENQDSISPN